MATPMDRDFGEDAFRRMERRKMAQMAGIPFDEGSQPDIEAPISPATQ